MESESYKGCNIKIEHDELAESPREWDAKLTVIVCRHNRYGFGDHVVKYGDNIKPLLDKLRPIVMVKNLYYYEHGNITVRLAPFNDPWDSGQVGVVLVPRKNVEECMGWNRITKKRRAILEQQVRLEIELYDQYLRGDVFSYVIEDENGEEIDSCGGFYGYDFENNGLMEYARNAIDYHIKQREDFQNERLDYVAQFCAMAPINAA